ncbi:uncharacterized protein G6M90_00g041510 [Metarhizium brunneum]|uniref:Beta-lactamase-related domain-containing protein n=1 Tax=Metarhizium brunneum TaxID=500148 RepID=A0A7D5YZA6_9HYPO|nr:hypothetical protein G6M90_00g041510 [Metarhizium brunneum]
MVSNLTHFTETRNLGRRSYNRTVPVEPGGITIVANRGTIPSCAAQTRAILGEKLVYKTGTKYLYPDLNFMTLMLAVEKVTGKKLDDNIYENTSLLRMHSSTFFNRGNVEGPEFKYYKPVHGTVHDENAWALDGVSGRAGLFSTACDMAWFCQMIPNNGIYGRHRILSKVSVNLIFTNFLADLGRDHAVGSSSS